MATFKLHVTCEGQAFDAPDPDATQTAHDNARNRELARILRYAADRLDHNTWGSLTDAHGTPCGSYGMFDDVYGAEAQIR